MIISIDNSRSNSS